MNWSDFLNEVLPMLLTILTALTSLIVTLIKNRQSAITKKVNKAVNLATGGSKTIDVTGYYFIHNNEKIYLKDLKIFKEE